MTTLKSSDLFSVSTRSSALPSIRSGVLDHPQRPINRLYGLLPTQPYSVRTKAIRVGIILSYACCCLAALGINGICLLWEKLAHHVMSR